MICSFFCLRLHILFFESQRYSNTVIKYRCALGIIPLLVYHDATVLSTTLKTASIHIVYDRNVGYQFPQPVYDTFWSELDL